MRLPTRVQGDGAVAPFAGFASDAVRKDFPVMEKDVPAWDWNSNDADVCCTGRFQVTVPQPFHPCMLGTPMHAWFSCPLR